MSEPIVTEIRTVYVFTTPQELRKIADWLEEDWKKLGSVVERWGKPMPKYTLTARN